MRDTAGSIRTQYEYQRAASPLSDDVARTDPDADLGVYIRGPRTEDSDEHVRYADLIDSAEVQEGNTARPDLGRRRYDGTAEQLITKKLVVVTVILVDALFLAGDALLSGHTICP